MPSRCWRRTSSQAAVDVRPLHAELGPVDGAEVCPAVRGLDLDQDGEGVQVDLVEVVADHVELGDGPPLVAVEPLGDVSGDLLVLLVQQRVRKVRAEPLEVDTGGWCPMCPVVPLPGHWSSSVWDGGVPLSRCSPSLTCDWDDGTLWDTGVDAAGQ